jgi:hypothetical protein
MSDPSLELQKRLVAALKALAMTEVGDRIYDRVPEAAAFPYLSIGDCQVLPDKAGCIDGSEVFLQIDAWSRATNYGETKTIAKQIVARLDDAEDLNVDGYDVIVFELQGVQHLRDPDGMTRHAAITFRTLVQPSS